MKAESLTVTLVARGWLLKRAVDEQPAQMGLTKVEKDAELCIGYQAMNYQPMK